MFTLPQNIKAMRYENQMADTATHLSLGSTPEERNCGTLAKYVYPVSAR
jgi:hypothetical protein